MTRSALEVRIHDSSISIWQDNARDESFRTEVYAELIRQMRGRGWSIRRDPNIYKNYRCLNADHRRGARGTLGCQIEIAGRVVKVEFWSTTAAQDNRHGRRFDFNKKKRMSHIDGLRVDLEFMRITRWLQTLQAEPIKVSRSGDDHLSPLHRIARRYAESWHTDKKLGRPVCGYASYKKSADGAELKHGQTVWFAHWDGRIHRGAAFYNINNMWWVIAGGELRNQACFHLYTKPPADIRTKRNEKQRRRRLERELETAVARMDFERACVLKRILFGTEQAYLIWACDKQLYYRSQYSGYATDRISAGKYTRAEAEAECRRVPHELEMVCPDGSHVRFDGKAAA